MILRKENTKKSIQINQLATSDCQLTLIDSYQQAQDSPIEAELDRAFRTSKEATALLDYRVEQCKSRSQKSRCSNVQDEDVQRLCTLIRGGYVQQDFSQYLSYDEFRQVLCEFDILRNIYQDVQKKYKLRKIEETQLKFRSLLLMVYLEQNIGKLSKAALDELFRKNKLVW